MIATFKLFYNTIAACQRPVGPLLSNKCMYVCMHTMTLNTKHTINQAVNHKAINNIYNSIHVTYMYSICLPNTVRKALASIEPCSFSAMH